MAKAQNQLLLLFLWPLDIQLMSKQHSTLVCVNPNRGGLTGDLLFMELEINASSKSDILRCYF